MKEKEDFYIDVLVITSLTKCSFCLNYKKPETMMIFYFKHEVYLKVTCFHHAICRTFGKSGYFCKNHEDDLDVQCDEIPF